MNDPQEFARVRGELETRYTLHYEIGRGGMATVFLATDLKHHRSVAIKILRPEAAAAFGLLCREKDDRLFCAFLGFVRPFSCTYAGGEIAVTAAWCDII